VVQKYYRKVKPSGWRAPTSQTTDDRRQTDGSGHKPNVT